MTRNSASVVDDRLHPAGYGVVLFLLVNVGRLPELLPFLQPLHLGKLSLVMALLGLFMASGGPRLRAFPAGPGRLLLLFVLLMVLSVGWSIWKTNSLQFLAGTMLSNLLLFVLLVKTTINPRMLRLYVGSLIGAGVLLAMMMVRAGGAERVSILSSYDPNDLALMLVTVLPLAVLGFFISRGTRRFMLAGLTGVLLVAILFTGSRGGFLALLAVAAYLFFSRLPLADGRLTQRVSPPKVLVVVLGAGLLLVATPQATWERMSTIFSPEDDYNLTEDTGRVAIWTRGVGAMAERPWGWGLLAFEAVEGERGGRFQASHNSLLQVGVELGIAGLVLVLMLYAACFRRLQALRLWAFANGPPRSGETGPPEAQDRGPLSLQLGALAIALQAGFIGYFVGAFFLSSAYTALFFTLVALVLALENITRLYGHTAAASAQPVPPAGTAPLPQAVTPPQRSGFVFRPGVQEPWEPRP